MKGRFASWLWGTDGNILIEEDFSDLASSSDNHLLAMLESPSSTPLPAGHVEVSLRRIFCIFLFHFSAVSVVLAFIPIALEWETNTMRGICNTLRTFARQEPWSILAQ